MHDCMHDGRPLFVCYQIGRCGEERLDLVSNLRVVIIMQNCVHHLLCGWFRCREIQIALCIRACACVTWEMCAECECGLASDSSGKRQRYANASGFPEIDAALRVT